MQYDGDRRACPLMVYNRDMSIESDGFPDEETKRFHVILAQHSLGQLSVTEAFDQGLRFEHGSYGAVLQDASIEAIRARIAEESSDTQMEP